MPNTWLVLDCSFLVYRATYAMADGEDATFGFLATVQELRQRFDCDNFAFCFDGDKLKRNDVLPTYKERGPREPEHERKHETARGCMGRLRGEVLYSLGFQNVFVQSGYEADDIMASVVFNSLQNGDDAIIVTSDKDLFQLLAPNVIIYNPNSEQITDESTFIDGWNILPEQWPMVKALAGCRSDNIVGIEGVGDKTAAQFLAGQLPKYSAKAQKIRKASTDEFEQRLKLVELPYEGVSTFTLKVERIDWQRVRQWGARSNA